MQREIRHRMRVRQHAVEVGDTTDEWDQFFVRANEHGLTAAQRELAEIGELDWEFDGPGVFGHAIAMNRLVELSAPLGQVLRRTARDVLFLEGKGARVPDVALADLIEPVVTGTFPGSFGLKIAGARVAEQLTLEGTLFERSAGRVVAVFKAAQTENPEEDVLSSLAGLRERTLYGLQRLASHLADEGTTSVIRWKGEEPVRISPFEAALVAATITDAEPQERVIEVTAQLELGSLAGQFHLVEQRPGGLPPNDYRGKVEEGAEASLEGVPVGATVIATLVVIELDSPLFETPRATYLLRDLRPVE